jgi:hypothetical protein
MARPSSTDVASHPMHGAGSDDIHVFLDTLRAGHPASLTLLVRFSCSGHRELPYGGDFN